MILRHVVNSVSITGLLVFTAWSFLSLSSQHNNTTINNDLLPDTIMNQVTALVLDKQGKPRMKISTSEMKHFAHNDASHLSHPQLTIYRKSAHPWFVTSTVARTSHGVQNIQFENNVIVQHAADANAPSTIIKTNTLLVHPATQVAETNDAIVLLQPNITVNAKGMYAEMENGDIKLLSEAMGTYEPSR